MLGIPSDPLHGAQIHRELFRTLYARLRRIAARELRRNAHMTLSPTTLLHETFLRLSPEAASTFDNEAHFMAYATRAMRGLIVDFMRSRGASKRGGDQQIIALPTEIPDPTDADLELGKLSEAIDALAAIQPRLAQCVELKFFCGFSFGEIARLWQVSERTVQRDWDKARLLLQQLIEERTTQQTLAKQGRDHRLG